MSLSLYSSSVQGWVTGVCHPREGLPLPVYVPPDFSTGHRTFVLWPRVV